MRSFRNLSIKRKMTVIIMLASGYALFLSCAVFVIYDRIMFKQTMALDLNMLADIIGAYSMPALLFNDAEDANETLAALHAEERIVAAHIYKRDGSRFASYVRSRNDSEDLLIGDLGNGYHFDSDHLKLSRRIEVEGKPIGAVYLKADLAEMHSRLKRYAGICGLVMFISSFGAFLVSSRLQRIISDPISHLAQVARTVSTSRDYSLRAQKRSQDELGFLTERFNEMLAQIQDRDAALQNARDQLENRAQQLQRELLERRRAGEQIKASLREKEVLLKEIHHRVKNNLQIISSLLELQSGSVTDPKAHEVFRECRGRVKSMALIHERLYQSKDISRIDLAEYVECLLASLRSSYLANPDRVSIRTRINNVFLTIDAAIPCGLIINELVSNALKYAFPDGERGEIEVELRSEPGNVLILSIRDNGVGLPEAVDVWNTETLGLQLVNLLTHQHSGEIELRRTGGTHFIITLRR